TFPFCLAPTGHHRVTGERRRGKHPQNTRSSPRTARPRAASAFIVHGGKEVERLKKLLTDAQDFAARWTRPSRRYRSGTARKGWGVNEGSTAGWVFGPRPAMCGLGPERRVNAMSAATSTYPHFRWDYIVARRAKAPNVPGRWDPTYGRGTGVRSGRKLISGRLFPVRFPSRSISRLAQSYQWLS